LVVLDGGGLRVGGGGGGVDGWRGGCFLLHSIALQSLEDVIDERLLGGDGDLEIGNLVF
jgi:hypothetical protein